MARCVPSASGRGRRGASTPAAEAGRPGGASAERGFIGAVISIGTSVRPSVSRGETTHGDCDTPPRCTLLVSRLTVRTSSSSRLTDVSKIREIIPASFTVGKSCTSVVCQKLQ